MKRAEPQPGTSGTKRKRTVLFTAQEVMDNLDDFDEVETQDDLDYPESEMEFVSDNEIDLSGDSSDEEEVDLGILGTAVRRGRFPCGSGDATTSSITEGWGKEYTPADTRFDNTQCGPQNIPAIQLIL